MAESTPVIVGPSLLRLVVILALSNLGIAVGLVLVCGLGWLSALLGALAVAASLLLFVLSRYEESLAGRRARAAKRSGPRRSD